MSRRRTRRDHAPTPEDLDAQQASAVENWLRADLATIADLWDDMLTTAAASGGGNITPGGAGDGGTLLDDDADDDSDTPRFIRVIDTRSTIATTLNGWCRIIIEDHNVQLAIPDGHDAPAMARFLSRWAAQLADHEAADVASAEISTAASTVRRYAQPQGRASLHLGTCPLTWQDPEDASDKPCPGILRAHDDGWIICSGCGTKAVASWWEDRVFGEDGAPLMTAAQVVSWLHRHYGMVVQPVTVRQWVARGDLARSGTDDDGRSLYDRAAIEVCLQRRTRRAQAGA